MGPTVLPGGLSMNMRRRRLRMLTFLAVALPTAALATSIDSNDPSGVFDTGTFVAGFANNVNAAGGWNLNSNPTFRVDGTGGTAARIILVAHLLGAGCQTAPMGMCSWTGGTVDVRFPTISHSVFFDTLIGGHISRNGQNVT